MGRTTGIFTPSDGEPQCCEALDSKERELLQEKAPGSGIVQDCTGIHQVGILGVLK